MNVTTDVVDGTVVVRVSGEIDMASTGAVENTVSAEVGNEAHGMILDLSDVTYLDSAGIRLLYHLETRLGMHQQRLVIVVPTGSVLVRTLQAAGVIGSLVLVSSLEAALAVAQVAEQRDEGSNGRTG